MALSKKLMYTTLSFVISIIAVCIINYVLQIVVIFLDIVSRLSSSSAFIIVLWIVTGVFAAVFTVSGAEFLAGKKNFSYKLTGNTVLIISSCAIVFAIILLVNGEFYHNPSDFSLLLSNAYVFLSFFTGSAVMGAVLRNLD